jgi:hypothetical protein
LHSNFYIFVNIVMNLKSKKTLAIKLFCTFCMCVFCNLLLFAQKIDTNITSLRPKLKIVNNTPQVKTNIQSYKPNIAYLSNSNLKNNGLTVKSAKVLSVLKIYPNPVVNQININLRLERESLLSIKIIDMLGQEIITLFNDRTGVGEQTKTYTIPSKLNAGIYFLRIIAGGEPVVRRISIL